MDRGACGCPRSSSNLLAPSKKRLVHTPIHQALGLDPCPLTWEIMQKAVEQRVRETASLDWKQAAYHEANPRWQFEACKDFAAMANSGGGWIVFGVTDKDDRADQLVGVKWSRSVEQRLRSVAVRRILPPLLGLEFIKVDPPEGSLPVVCLRVPAHGDSLRVVTPEENTFKVPYRNGPDTEFHGPREVGMALLSAVRSSAPAPASTPQVTPQTPLEQLKSWLGDQSQTIVLRDLIIAETKTVVSMVEGQPLIVKQLDGEAIEAALANYRDSVQPLIELMITGIWHDASGVHDQVWVDALQMLVTAGTAQALTTLFQKELLKARLYPAALLLFSAGIAAVVRGRENLFIRLCTDVFGVHPDDVRLRIPACQILHPWLVLDADTVRSLPRWNGARWTYPASHLLKTDTRAFFRNLIPDNTEFTDGFHGVEYRLGLLQEQTKAQSYPVGSPALSGEYVGELGWTFGSPRVPHAEVAFREAGKRNSAWPWTKRLGGTDAYEQTLLSHRKVLENYQYHRMR